MYKKPSNDNLKFFKKLKNQVYLFSEKNYYLDVFVNKKCIHFIP